MGSSLSCWAISSSLDNSAPDRHPDHNHVRQHRAINGLPLVSFAFGEQALSYAGIYFATTTLLFYTLGVFLASLGHMNFKEAYWDF